MTIYHLTTFTFCFFAFAGCAQFLLATNMVCRFCSRSRTKVSVAAFPPVTVLKPLCGEEPCLFEALSSFCRQDYPAEFQIILGVRDPSDATINLIRILQKTYPDITIDLVINPVVYGTNKKISNLINMLEKAHHEVLIFSDSDIHVKPDYLRKVASELMTNGVGMVTTVYGGLPINNTAHQIFAASQINHVFLPSVILSRYLGRQDCLGATMAIRRQLLDQIGGLHKLLPYVADDAALGQFVRETGQNISLAFTLPLTTIAEKNFVDLYRHELRWGRTVRSIEPIGYVASSVQFPIFWALLVAIMHAGSPPAWIFLLACWGIRAICANLLDKMVLGYAVPASILWLPLRELLSVTIMLASLRGRKVLWRGQNLNILATRSTGPSAKSS